MKLKLSIFILLVAQCLVSIAQTYVPQGINYQGMATSTDGSLLTNQPIVVEITLRKSYAQGPVVWQEIHTLVTNEYGVFTLVIGQGARTEASTIDKFRHINWSGSLFFIQTRIDFGVSAIGNGLIDLGTVQLMSVPYAFKADRAVLADSALVSTPPNLKLTDLKDISVAGVSGGQVLMWDGTFWTGSDMLNGNFLSADGSTDLTGNWVVSKNNIALTDGSLSLTNGGVSLLNGQMQSKSVKTESLLLASGNSVTGISDDATLGTGTGSSSLLATQAAIKTYIQNNVTTTPWTVTGSNLYTNTTYLVGIGTQSPQAKLHVETLAGEGFLVSGSYLTGTAIPNTGAGSKLFYFPSKAALRAGALTTGSLLWSNDSIGAYSVAFGKNTKASSVHSIAMGNGTRAEGNASMAVGTSNSAKGINSIAFGERNVVEGDGSMVIGRLHTKVKASNTLVLGSENSAEFGDNSLVGGYKCSANGDYGILFGQNVKSGTTATNSIGIGNTVYLTGSSAAAIGKNLSSSSVAEIALGMNIAPYPTPSGAIGVPSPFMWQAADRLLVLGNGKSGNADSLSNAVTVWKDGKMAVGYEDRSVFPDDNALLAVQGNIISSGSLISSDKRLKTQVLSIDSPLQKVTQLEGVYYRWVEKPLAPREIGFLAQDVEKIIPEVVATGANGYKYMDYAKITALLVEAIKEQQGQIELLQQRIIDLETQK